MNNDKKVTFTDIFANTKPSSEENPKTFSSVAKENENKDNITLDKLLESNDQKKEESEIINEEPSLKSSNIFKDAINSTENKEVKDEKTERTNEIQQLEPLDFNDLSNAISQPEEENNSNENVFSSSAVIFDNIDKPSEESDNNIEKNNETQTQEETLQTNASNNLFFNDESKEEINEPKENVFSNSAVNFDNVDESSKESEENESPKESNNPFFSNEQKEETIAPKEDVLSSNVINFDNVEEPIKETEESNNLFFNDETNESNEQEETKDNIFSNSIKFDTKEENEQRIDDNPFFEMDEKLEPLTENNTTKKETPKEKINDSKKENEYRETSPFFADEDSIKEQTDNNPFFNNSINLVEDTKTTHTPQNNVDLSNTKHYNVKIVKKKEPLIKFILGVLSYALFILLLLIGITLLIYVADIKIRASKGDYSAPKYNAYVVLTGSMLPEIQVYDVVVTKKTESADLKEGDVITFASSDSRFAGTIITHRIIKKNYDADKKTYTFQTKGDNNNVADSALVESNNIYGKVILKIPKLGYLQEFLATDGGWIIVILIPCLAVMSYDIVKLAKGLKRKKRKNLKVQKK